MTDELLEENSRTLKTARGGQWEEWGKLIGIIGTIYGFASGAPPIFQYVGVAIIALLALSTMHRWIKVKRYRREDHRTGKNRKVYDVPIA